MEPGILALAADLCHLLRMGTTRREVAAQQGTHCSPHRDVPTEERLTAGGLAAGVRLDLGIDLGQPAQLQQGHDPETSTEQLQLRVADPEGKCEDLLAGLQPRRSARVSASRRPVARWPLAPTATYS